MSLALFGLVFGSFANVVIWRLPRRESLSHPDSHCPVCETPIQWRDNIPVLSWLLLHGRCRACGVAISPRYPIVELMSGGLWLLAGWRFGFSAQALFAVTFFYMLLVLGWIDIDTMRLPNVLVGLLAIVGAVGAVFAQATGASAVPLIGLGAMGSSPIVVAFLGALFASVPALALSLLMQAVLKRPALGMGDVKLLGVIGIFLGAYGLMSLFVGSVVGVVFALAARRRHGVKSQGDPLGVDAEDSWDSTNTDVRVAEDMDVVEPTDPHEVDETPTGFSGDGVFPFGPALSAGAVIVTMVGPQLWAWYQSLFTM